MSDDLYKWAGIQPEGAGMDLYEKLGATAVRAAPNTEASWIESFLHHATGGLADKAEAALKATGIVSGGAPGETWSDRYHKDLANARRDIQAHDAVNPGWEGAKSAKAAGVIAPMFIAGPEAAAAKSLPQAAGRAATTGAVAGGLYGFGSTDDESLAENLTATGLGAITGGVAGPALVVGQGIARSPFTMAGRAASVFGDEGAKVAAGRVIKEAANGYGVVPESPPIPGMKLTTGQSTNNPGLQWLERNVSQASPHGADLASLSQTSNNTAIRSAIGGLGDADADASTAMSAALDRAYTNQKKITSDLWKKADVSNSGGVSGFQFNNFMKKHVAGLPVPDQAQVPQDVMQVMEKMAAAKTQNLSDVQSVRSMLSSRATQAARAGDGNLARILGGMADKVEDFIDIKAANLGPKFPLYNDARASTREMKQTFNQHPDIRKALGVDSYGADKLPVSATADQFIRKGKGAPESLNAYLKAISTKDAAGKVTYDPEGLKAAQDAFTGKFLSTVTNASTDSAGQKLVSPAQMQKFLDEYSHVINSPMFSQPQRDMIGKIAKATQMASRSVSSAPPGRGSDTFQKLQGDRFIDALIGPQASKLVDTIGKVGGSVAGYLGEGKVGAVAGFIGGEKAAGMLKDLYAAPRDKVVKLITEAMHDPQLAKDLMMKASNSNAKLIPLPRRARILGILGAQSAPMVVEAATAH